jgi:transaldolase
MHLYLETADPVELREGLKWRVVDGIATTPSLLAKRGGDSFELLRELCALVDGPVAAEVTAGDTRSILEEARALADLHERIIVRIPCTPAAVPAIVDLAGDRIPVDATLCFSVAQALLVAKAGARLISVPVGALDDAGGDGLGLMSAVLTMLDQYELKTSVVAAGLQNPGHVAEAARMGADAVSLPLSLLRAMAQHPLTEMLRQQQLESWRRAQN